MLTHSADNTCPVEIISPILRDNHNPPEERWEPEVDKIFRALNKRGRVSTNTSCGTHVHLSPGSERWSLEDLKKLSCCILYFERAFEALYPEAEWPKIYAKEAQRNKRARHAKANWTDNKNLREKSYVESVEDIRGIKNVAKLIELMNPPDEYYEDPPLFCRRSFAWNFTNLGPTTQGTESGTVEYRRPPGVQSSNACVSWVRLAIAFVRAVLQVDDPIYPLPNEKDSPEHVHVSHLKDFLETGLPPGHNMETYFGKFFEGKTMGLKVIPVIDRYAGELSEEDEEVDQQ
jgi:hypothetical protein